MRGRARQAKTHRREREGNGNKINYRKERATEEEGTRWIAASLDGFHSDAPGL